MKHDVSPYFFYFFAAISILPGIFVLATKDIVRAAFWLLLALSGFAGLYVLLGADFLAVTQVVVYLGGILILILFGVMLTHRDPALVRKARRLNIVVPGIAGGAVLAIAVAAATTRAHFAVPAMQVVSILPSFGPPEGGQLVQITGTNLGAVTTVTFGSGKDKGHLENLKVEDNVIQGTTPRHHKAELVTVALVTTMYGTLVADKSYAYGNTPPTAPIHASKPLPLKSDDFKGTTADLGAVLVASNDDPQNPRSFLLAFEIASVLLLAALVGAAYLARRGGEHGPYEVSEEGRLHG
ncbi:MAG: NADH-quinone oxidoreductase subunit J [Planctomycetota bacterium]